MTAAIQHVLDALIANLDAKAKSYKNKACPTTILNIFLTPFTTFFPHGSSMYQYGTSTSTSQAACMLLIACLGITPREAVHPLLALPQNSDRQVFQQICRTVRAKSGCMPRLQGCCYHLY